MISSFKRLVAALALIVPVVALVASPVMAATHHKHHTGVHKANAHKAHGKKAAMSTTS